MLDRHFTEGIPEDLQPISCLDVVSGGYKRGLKGLKAMTLLTWPGLLICGMFMTGFYRYLLTPSFNPEAELLISLANQGIFYMVACFFAYGMARYLADMYRDDPPKRLIRYLIPDWSLLGVSLIGALCSVSLAVTMFMVIAGGMLVLAISAWLLGAAAIVEQLRMLVGFLFIGGVLVFYGVIILAAVTTTVVHCLMASMYLLYPEEGLGFAVWETAKLVLGRNFWRTVGLSLGVTLVTTALMSPLLLLDAVSAVLMESSPGMMESLAFTLLCTGLFAVHVWVVMDIGFSGFLFTMFRYCMDMQIRAGRFEPSEDAVIPIDGDMHETLARQA